MSLSVCTLRTGRIWKISLTLYIYYILTFMRKNNNILTTITNNNPQKALLLRHGVHQFLIVKFHDFLMTFSGAIDIFSWPLRVKFNDFFRTQKRRRRENFFRYLRKMNVFEELWEIAKKSWLFQVFKVFSWLVFAFHDFFQVLQVFQDYQVFQVSGHHDIVCLWPTKNAKNMQENYQK